MLFLESHGSLWLVVLSAFIAVGLDWWLGEPRRFHPLVGFGCIAKKIERYLNPHHMRRVTQRSDRPVLAVGLGTAAGLCVFLLVMIPLGFLFVWLQQSESVVTSFVLSTLLLYLAIGHKSLRLHAQAVTVALESNDLKLARERVGYIVSRQTENLSETEVVKATLESVLENGSDAVFAPLFWFLVAGPLGVVLYRMANTLDAMWGYRNDQFTYFGWFVARFDDLLNWLPARLCALTYILSASINRRHIKVCLSCWRLQAPLCESPNAGPVMSSGAAALNVTLGGGAQYFNQWHDRPVLGRGNLPVVADIDRANALLFRGVVWWLLFSWVVVGGALYV